MCVRWNVAAMMSQVAAGQEDSDAGIQAAAKYFQQAAGIFLFVKEHMAGVLNKEVPTSDISAANLNTLCEYFPRTWDDLEIMLQFQLNICLHALKNQFIQKRKLVK